VVAFNTESVKELGFFLVLDQKKWELTEEEKHNRPKRRITKQEFLKDYFHLPTIMKKNGFKFILDKLQVEKNPMELVWKTNLGKTKIDLFDAYYDRFLNLSVSGSSHM